MNLRLHLNNRTRRANMCVEKKTCRWEKSETFVSTRVAGVVVGCSLVAVKMNACVLHLLLLMDIVSLISQSGFSSKTKWFCKVVWQVLKF